MMLDMHGITVATGSACASQGLKANYVMMAMGKTHVQSHGSMKFTLSRLIRVLRSTPQSRLWWRLLKACAPHPLYNAVKNQEK
jgi:hypothetical protein